MKNIIAPTFFVLFISLGSASAQDGRTTPADPIRRNDPGVFALVRGRVVASPGKIIAPCTIVVRDRSLVAVGRGIPIPREARVIDLKGKYVYAGFIDAYSSVSIPGPGTDGAPHWNAKVIPQANVSTKFKVDAEWNAKLREQGVAARLVAPAEGIIKGQSALFSTHGETDRHLIRDTVALHLRLTVPRGGSEYPNSPMGAVALARQAFYDARWYLRAWQAYRVNGRLKRPENNDALAALQSFASGGRPVVIDAQNELYALRADRFAREFQLRAVLRGSGNEYRRLAAIRDSGRSILLPVNFPKPPNVGAAEAALNISLESLMHWDLAPENPGRLERAGIEFAITTDGLEEPKELLKNIRRAIERGLTPNGALKALTVTPARLLGVEKQLGTIQAGKLASFVITDGKLFAEKTKIVETWVDGRRYEHKPRGKLDPVGVWSLRRKENKSPIKLSVADKKDEPGEFEGRFLVEKDVEVEFARLSLLDARLSGAADAEKLGSKGFVQLTLVLDSTAGRALGSLTWPDGSRDEIEAVRTSRQPQPAKTEKKDEQKKSSRPSKQKKGAAPKQPHEATPLTAINFPLGAFGRTRPPAQARLVLFKNATIWTCGPKGLLKNASMLVAGGKIVAVGQSIEPPKEAVIVDLAGKHLSPGIIDCHSHMATDGGVNESGQSITAEVRIGDFIDCDDINIYRQLAGGVTTSNILHGSANPIGGQNQVIKLRWGSLPEEMKFKSAPAGIKFALGENVKRSNRREPSTRYPQSRMGVEQIIRDEFVAARAYEQQWQRWHKQPSGLPPRRDLEMDAIVEILAGKRWIHCHSYRQDEILMLMRLLEGFKVRIGTFQHILEGYKVADAMARHGAMGSAFSDWWAYKFEVYDAIPFNGALMHQSGVVVSFNSDDRELARHLNHEAAKAIKYGGVPPTEALKFVTLNPAKQLRIDRYVGSLEAGKHADFVIWNRSPLSTMSRCEETWIDGRKYFDRKVDQQLRRQSEQLRARLIQKILASGEAMLAEGEAKVPEEELWARDDIFCRAHRHDGSRFYHQRLRRSRMRQRNRR